MCENLVLRFQVKDLLGSPEPSLVDYVVKLLSQASSPAKVFSELQPVLDHDTDMFVVKLFRMIIYETEKNALGL